ncbi:hypothetical protein FA15DRAFT_162532 [Coprinopsis marcescibilis]|uniref:t-SNARE coiled-coil homology domain-containing protein n=1 Tax=Coprinopsis marcescibilis TaxID=230819 RepID=A0A5C3KHT6_COPMA|nr:hypothetical protein FA15DRAFT_162532 [Coprinopsis marcescibilis]
MSSSRGQQRVEDVYEQQNDQKLDELHSKLRTLRGITSDINADVEAQNLILDQTNDHFGSFGTSLSQASQRARHAFGLAPNGSIVYKPWRLAIAIVLCFLGLWMGLKVFSWFRGGPPA